METAATLYKETSAMSVKNMKTVASTSQTLVLADAATSAHDALAVGHQMMDMLREYTQLEAEHATRLQRLAQRMGDCVDRMRVTTMEATDNNQVGDDHQQEGHDEDELRQRQSQCVAVMDEVVTFLTRFGSMHRHLSECLAGDLFDEWSGVLRTQKTRMDTHEPELGAFQQQLEDAEQAYRRSHDVFQAEFDKAGVDFTRFVEATGSDDAASLVQEQFALASVATPAPQRRERSSSKAMQYVGSLSRLLLPSTVRREERNHRRASVPNDGDNTTTTKFTTTIDLSQLDSEARTIAQSIIYADQLRQQCREAYDAMHRLHVRHTRLCDSLFHEYQCVQSECLASTRTSIRKLVIHLSAFTSNLQYDATQLFQQVEALHAVDHSAPQAHESPFTASSQTQFASTHPAPPLDQPLSVGDVARQHFPVVNARPRLLRHQNARLALAV